MQLSVSCLQKPGLHTPAIWFVTHYISRIKISSCFITEGTPPAGFDSLSPGDVESISEGEIPEAEGEVETEVKEEPTRVTQPTPPAPSPLLQVEDTSLEAEPFEPILSDEEIGDDCDAQVDKSYRACYYSPTSLIQNS